MFNPSDFQYRSLQTAAATHDRNAVNLSARAKDTRYSDAVRATFSQGADTERQAAKLARDHADHYKAHGYHHISVAA